MLRRMWPAGSWPACGGTRIDLSSAGLPMSFDALAAHYRWMGVVLAGNKRQPRRTTFLDRAGRAQNVLLLGEGNGRFLVECRRKSRDARITCLDASGWMLSLARARLRRGGLSSEGI